jgi:hypothetical protein
MGKVSEDKIKSILRSSNKPLDCENIARRLHSLKYINKVNSVLSKLEKQGLVQAV